MALGRQLVYWLKRVFRGYALLGVNRPRMIKFPTLIAVISAARPPKRTPRFMDQFAKETIPVSIEEEMRRSYLDYAMSVIVGRALPDVRDGLKPVHRRVLFAMHEANN